MKRTPTLITIVVLALVLVFAAGLSVQLPQGAAHAQDPDRETPLAGIAAPQALVGTSFTYQGRLTEGGSPANGEYNLRFDLYDAATGGALLGTVTVPDHQVTAGLFTVQLDFGAVFTGMARYLEIRVRPAASGGRFTTLSPRQELTPVPYALALPGLWTQQNATSPNLIGGHISNTVAPGVVGAVIGGGGSDTWPNAVLSNYATIGGGGHNDIGNNSQGCAIGGGVHNEIGTFSFESTIGGGWDNDIGESCRSATVGGGEDNDIGDESASATIGGGETNNIGNDSDGSTIGGGSYNVISGTAKYATIPGGRRNEAWGHGAFAAGRRAQANHDGAFVWADSTDADFASQWDDQFRVRANGGVRLDVNNGYWFDFRNQIVGFTHRALDTSTGAYLDQGGVWVNSSDRNLKENLSPVDGQDVLSRLAEMPVQTWNYKTEGPAVRRIGPTAQDFYAAFGLGADNLHISTIDADGVALAAIQGLYEQNQEQTGCIAELEMENAALQAQVDALRPQVDALRLQNAGFEARLAALEQGGVADSSALGLPTWLLLGGLVLAGGVALERRRTGGGK